MKIKMLLFVGIILLLFGGALPLMAQPAHACGSMDGFSVTYARIDAAGYAPRPSAGSETRFECISQRDPNFAAQRFDTSWQALNYWFVLYGQELGVTLFPLPAPTG